jgi:hypothetical protein
LACIQGLFASIDAYNALWTAPAVLDAEGASVRVQASRPTDAGLVPGFDAPTGSVAAIQLGRETGVTVSGMCFSLGKSLPSLGHLNQKGLLSMINGCACALQTPHSISLAIFCDRHLSSP